MNHLIIKTDLLLYKNKENYNDDSGFDLYVPKDIIVPPFNTINKGFMIDLELSCEMIKNNNNVGYYLYPRSSIYKTPLRMCNSVGIIDAGYRGELMAVFDNISDESYELKPYTRLLQACFPDLNPFSVAIVNKDFDTTSRGEGGLGSTGT